MSKRLVLIVVAVVLVAVWHLFDLGHYLTLDMLKAEQGRLEAVYQNHALLTIAVFLGAYIAVTALSVPGAAVLTVAAGALFGLFAGTVIVSFASSIGATLAFLASRYLFRDAVERRFGQRLNKLQDGMVQDGAFYLLSLRLVPVFPFFLVNLAMGLTAIRTWTFYWVSQVGMLLGTIIYVNAGTQLAHLNSLSDVASPGLLLSLAALGLLPWLGKLATGVLRRRRVYARWRQPKSFDRNLVVIGAGAAGLVSAYIAATVKAKVTLVEAGKMGGDCLNFGCVPSKALIKSARIADQMRHADRYGVVAQAPTVNIGHVMQRIRDVIKAIEPHDSVERYRDLGVDVVPGYARIRDPWTVEIAGNDGTQQTLTTRAIVIAAGAEPFVPPIEGLEGSGFVTSDTLWDTLGDMDAMPERIVVLGGGPIGCELSQALARLGANVSQIEMGPRLLIREDEDVSRLVEQAQVEAGVSVLTRHEAVRVEKDGSERSIIVRHDGEERPIPFDMLIVAVGRKARLEGYGLETLGIETSKTVSTDVYLATLYPNIYAAGDVAGPYQFTHVAAHQAWYASVNALFGQFRRFKADYRVIPWTTFTDPEVARVGLNEQEAREKGIEFETTVFPLHELDRAIAESETTGFVRVLTPPKKDKILGVTIVGAHAGELLAEYVLAMKHGLGLNKVLGTIHSYPTFAEANKYVAGEWRRKHAPAALLRVAEAYHRWRRGTA